MVDDIDIPAQGTVLRGLRVLIVEDEFLLADDLRRALASQGAQVVGPTADEETALKLLNLEACDCAILDINLQGKPSFKIARSAQAKGIPAAFTTGYDQDVVPAELESVEHFEKPFDMPTLVGFVARVTRRSGRTCHET
jgi:DNA-binding response OmpR family regulator